MGSSSIGHPRLRSSARSIPWRWAAIHRSPPPATCSMKLPSLTRPIGLDANSVYGMVTNRAADVLRLRQGEGRLWPGSVADMVGVRDIGLSPAETLAQLTMEQVELVIVCGRVQLASHRPLRATSLGTKGGIATSRSRWSPTMGARSHRKAAGRRRRVPGERSSSRRKESAPCLCCMRSRLAAELSSWPGLH